MKNAKILSTSGSDRATVLFTHDDGTTSQVENLGPLPLGNEQALASSLEAYESAYVSGVAQALPGESVAVGTVLVPVVDAPIEAPAPVDVPAVEAPADPTPVEVPQV
jgi:hypothetical protein